MALIESFWNQQCPARGAGLEHAHWSKCQPDGFHPVEFGDDSQRKHLSDQCCHCEARASIWYKEQERIRDEVKAREQIGWPGHEHVWWSGKCATCPATDPRSDLEKALDREDVPVEQKSITGTGPIGPKRGEEKAGPPAHGRFDASGHLTPEDETRLGFFVFMVRDTLDAVAVDGVVEAE